MYKRQAFALEADEISDIIEKDGRFYIQKCVNAYDQQATALRKERLAQKKKKMCIRDRRYGTVPIVRETGGLRDTVQPYNEFESTGTGFSFANYNAHEMLGSVRYAKYIYYNKRREWNKIIDRDMACLLYTSCLSRILQEDMGY